MGRSFQAEVDMTDAYNIAAKLVGVNLSEYPVRYHSPRLSTGIPEIREWCWDEEVDCIRAGTFWFFRDESDRLRFMLRWGD